MTRLHLLSLAALALLIGCPASSDDDDSYEDYAADDDDAWYDDDDDATPPMDDDDDGEEPVSDDDDATGDDDDATGDDDDATPEDGDDVTCLGAVEEPTLWYLSADDSNSQADAAHIRQLIADGMSLSGHLPLRPWELFNYYDWDYADAPQNELVVDTQLRADPADPELYDLVVGITSPAMSNTTRPDFNLVFAVDTSCSMGPAGMDAARETLVALSSQLRSGDVVSVVDWDDSVTIPLSNHAVSGPDDSTLAAAIATLIDDGSTDLELGLSEAYSLALASHDPEKLNRVILVSDGGANTGITSENLIAQHAADGEAEQIYLVGVGTPPADIYNDDLMNTVTDLGKGAYVYIDEPQEAWRQFTGERMLSNLGLSAKNVRLELTLPPGFAIERFYVEEISQNPDEVEPQHLGPNDSMVYVVTLRDCSADGESGLGEFGVTATWEELSGAEAFDREVITLDELLVADARAVYKARALMAYADAVNGVWAEASTQRRAFVDGHWEDVNGILQSFPEDEDLQEVLFVLGQFRTRF